MRVPYVDLNLVRCLILPSIMSVWIGMETARAQESESESAKEQEESESAQTTEAKQVRQHDVETIYVIGPRRDVGEVGKDQVSSTITQEEMRQFNRNNVGDALNTLSGVSISTNSRNEKTISVRGYDSRQMPLFIDGIPVYVPYDGYMDFNRLTTSDLTAIQVAKGYSSVAYGPNTIGGAINLISRKPIKAFEGDVSAGMATGNERTYSANLGTNQGAWYVQGGGSYLISDGFPLPHDFKPTSTEDGGMRNNSYQKDHKASLKIGLTPNTTDEYAVTYYKQHGEKGQPPSIDAANARYWRWPYWDKAGVYFVSKTALSEYETLKVRLFEDQYDNEVVSYTDDTYSTLKTSGKGSVSTGRSIYHDRSNGGSVEWSTRRINANTFRLVGHYKLDRHVELDGNDQKNASFKDTLFSLGAEDSVQVHPDVIVTAGVSHHELRPEKVFSVGNAYSLPSKKAANDLQAGVYYSVSPSARTYMTVAKKTRHPTLKDRYSQRLGTFIENPDLKQETSLNYELGYQSTPWESGEFEAAVFHSDARDRIQAVANVSGTQSQMQNIGKTQASGFEIAAKDKTAAWLELGGNYTQTVVKNLSDRTLRITDTPRHKVTGHTRFLVTDSTDVTLFGEHNSSRWASNTVELHEFSVFNLKFAHRPMAQLGLEAGVTNITDKNYELSDGFPNPGRMFFANARYQF